MFKGSIVALVTPFKDGDIDAAAFQSLVEWQIEQGTDGLVPAGTTGESPTLSHEEHKRIVDLCIEAAAGRAPVIAGAGSNSTAEAVSLARYAHKAGADAVLVVTPYYNKPTAEGLYLHYKAIHDAVDIPIIIYNIPSRSVIDMSVETMTRLAKLERIVGVKDATGDPVRVSATRRQIGPDFCQLSGDDASALALLALGGHGCISVTANVVPGLCAAFQDAWAAGKTAEALALQDQLIDLHQVLFVEANPAPVKYALHLCGRCQPETRLPLAPLSEGARQRVRGVMQAMQLL